MHPSSQRTTVIAHRGASAYAAEHTFAAYDLAIAQGADMLELEVRATADGQLVVLHDRTLLRTAADPRPIRQDAGGRARGARSGRPPADAFRRARPLPDGDPLARRAEAGDVDMCACGRGRAAELERLITIGVDGVITDAPDVARELVTMAAAA